MSAILKNEITVREFNIPQRGALFALVDNPATNERAIIKLDAVYADVVLDELLIF